ncbi:SAM-dependent methyltransferase [Streptomyces sp. NBC_01795]|uniref:class I SAM-dependent methyltransferase n=1 Tax=unclassified Streptomyces TaxID=2593676 RepID=UPI002DDABE2F|nr:MULTISPECIES: SAM-dependent methyltransferase [unclassified Streptomyces]WSA93407.1 SAM-dependent methyltransferase [Streptomyces sp. NBC_01795]WSS13976.1 SAM-dependent methyltransferase [Streptomyces sp. NBC_01186]
MTETMDAVGRTALLTAAMRALESRRPDRLYTDPYAQDLCGEEGPKLLDEVRGATFPPHRRRAMPDSLDVNAIRTRFFDDLLQRASQDHAQIVSAASGVDSRPYRLEWPPNVRYFEIDRPSVLDYKRDRLAGVRPRVAHRMVAADLTAPGWERRLEEAGYEAKAPSVWLLEGVLPYLHEDEVHRLLQRIRTITAAGSLVAGDLVNSEALTLAHARGQLDVFARWGCPWRFGTDEPEALFGRHRFTAEVVQPGDPSANYGRWQDPVPPRSVPGVRRIFLVCAERC